MNHPDRYRRSIRLKGYDYTQPGVYFITIATYNRTPVLGNIEGERCLLTELGEIAEQEWEKLPSRFSKIRLDVYVVMPNHLHGILVIQNCAEYPCESPTEQFGRPVSGSIPTIVRSYKSIVTLKGNLIRRTPGGVIWQRNYYEHIIRDEKDWDRIREYITHNPAWWKDDQLWYGGP